jgi:Aspartyl/Asparaginyl beta-hydroxylase
MWTCLLRHAARIQAFICASDITVPTMMPPTSRLVAMRSAQSVATQCASAVRCYSTSRLLLFAASHETSPSSTVVKGSSLLQTSFARPSPSLLHLPGLRSLPFWTRSKGSDNIVAYRDPVTSQAVDLLQQHYETILEEYKLVACNLPSDYSTDNEHLLHQGTWDWHSYMNKGKLRGEFAERFPQTTAILQQLDLFEGTPFGYAFFSTLHAHSRIAAHTGPMNFRLRIHLPLIVPVRTGGGEQSSGSGKPAADTTNSSSNDDALKRSLTSKYPCAIRVGNEIREWIPGQALVLDDSYNHEVWNETDEVRVLLLVDIWHPDVMPEEREQIVNMFAHAREKGWVS